MVRRHPDVDLRWDEHHAAHIGRSPHPLHTWPIDYYFALFHFLSNGNIIQIPADPS